MISLQPLCPGALVAAVAGVLLLLSSGAAAAGPARWSAADLPVELCTSQLGRPDWISAPQFRNAARTAAEAWSIDVLPPLVRYTGDCAPDHGVSAGNGRNEIGWDDLAGDRAGIGGLTRQFLRAVTGAARARLTEADVLLSRSADGLAPARTFERGSIQSGEWPLTAAYAASNTLGPAAGPLSGLILHELGHALGLEHTAAEESAMRARLVGDVAVSPGDARRIVEMYGGCDGGS